MTFGESRIVFPPSPAPARGANAAFSRIRRDTPSSPNCFKPVKRRRHRARRLTAHGRSVVHSPSFAIRLERLFSFFPFFFVPKRRVVSVIVSRPTLAAPLQRLLRVARVGVPAGGGDALDARAFPLAEHGGDESRRRRRHGLD
jgi:hypothetical protein